MPLAAQEGPRPDQLAESDVDMQRRFNELRSEFLDRQEGSINRWVDVLVLLLTFFGALIAIASLVAFTKFKGLADEASASARAANLDAQAARNLVGKIRKNLEKSEAHVSAMKRKRGGGTVYSQNAPEVVPEVSEASNQDPGASPTDEAIGRASSLEAQGRTDEAIRSWGAIAESAEASEKKALAAKAWIRSAYLLAASSPKDAIEDFSKAIDLDPDNAKAYYNRGTARAQLEMHEAALADFDKAIELDPASATVYCNRGAIKAKMKRLREAIPDFSKAIELDPGDATAYYNRGVSKAALGRHSDAERDFEAAGALGHDVDAR